MEFLDLAYKPQLFPEELYECARHRSWIGFANELAQEIASFVKQGKMLTHDLSRMNELFTILNQHIKAPYFWGDIFSMVDIALISHILWIDALEQQYLPFTVIARYPSVDKWLLAMKNRPSIHDTMGNDYAKRFIQLLRQYNLIEDIEYV